MEVRKVTIVYFSATYTTRKVVRALAQTFGCEVTELDVTSRLPETEVRMAGEGELLIVGMPVYAGRITATGSAGPGHDKGRRHSGNSRVRVWQPRL